MKKKAGKAKFNNLKKTIKNFIKDEEGFISKENILKIGLGTISALSILGSFSNSIAAHGSHASHSNTNFLISNPVAGTKCWTLAGSHTSHASHASHNAY